MSPLWISALGTAMMGLSAVVASWAGIRGLDAWRAEIVGRRKAELAEEVLAQFYHIRDVVAWARLPMPLDPVAGETAGEAVDRQNAAARAPVERLAAESQVFSQLQASRYRFMAYFGEERARPFDEVRAVHAQIINAASELARGGGEQADRERWAQTVGWGRLDADALGSSLDHAIKAIEKTCRPLIDEPFERHRFGRRRRS